MGAAVTAEEAPAAGASAAGSVKAGDEQQRQVPTTAVAAPAAQAAEPIAGKENEPAPPAKKRRLQLGKQPAQL